MDNDVTFTDNPLDDMVVNNKELVFMKCDDISDVMVTISMDDSFGALELVTDAVIVKFSVIPLVAVEDMLSELVVFWVVFDEGVPLELVLVAPKTHSYVDHTNCILITYRTAVETIPPAYRYRSALLPFCRKLNPTSLSKTSY